MAEPAESGVLRRVAMRSVLSLTRRKHLRGRLRLAMFLNRFLMPPDGYVRSRFPDGLKMEIDLTDRLQRIIHYCGDYEPDERNYIVSALPRDGVFVDVGANVGWHTLAAARHLNEGGRVYAFEPMPANVERILRNLELNGLLNVAVEQMALSDRDETVEIASRYARSGNATMAQRDVAAQRHSVRAVRLDEYARDHGIERIHLVKIDVEGAEVHVLRGMSGIFKCGDAPLILTEMNPTMLSLLSTSADEMLDLMGNYGYSAFRMESRGRLQPLESIPSVEEHCTVVFIRDGRR